MTNLRLICALLVLTAGLPAPGSAEDTEAPLVDAGLDQTVTRGSTVYLDAGGTVDADGEVVGYSWRIETPRGRSIRPTDPDAELTRFVPNSTGRYRVTLTATDDDDNSRSDTLYVDVSAGAQQPRTSPPSDGPPDANGPGAQTPPPQSDFQPPGGRTGPPSSDVGPIADDSSNANQAPYGQIYGPNSVKAGRTGRYSLQATDQDGHIIDYWWVPPGELTGQGRELEAHTVGKSYSFDVEPGTTVEIPVVIMDNDGARSSISKTVQVANNQPRATLVGNETVVVGSVNRYEAVASDPDGPIVEYDWEADSSVESVNTGGLLGGQSSSGRSTLYRFTKIPQDDATATVSITVEDEHGGKRTVRKEVTVVSTLNKDELSPDPSQGYDPRISTLSGVTIPGSENVFGNKEFSNSHKFRFAAAATDNDSDRLIFHWKFGNEGTARTVENEENPRSVVEFMFEPIDSMSRDIDISVTVEDENGRTATVNKILTLNPGGAVRSNRRSINVVSTDEGIINGYVTLPTDKASYDVSKVELFLGDGTSQSFSMVKRNSNQIRFQFDHHYRFGGTYTLYLFDGNSRGATYGKTDVSIQKRTYTEWNFERKVTTQSSTIAEEKPGQDWKRDGIDHQEKYLVETRETTTPLLDGTTLNPGPNWERVGTETTYHTEVRTKRATESPGAAWRLTERRVAEKRVISGWNRVTVSHRGIADDSWSYVGLVPRTVDHVQHEESTTRPTGDGWVRDGRTGYERVGYDYEWVNSRWYASADWDYVRSDRYVRYYRTETECRRYSNFGGYRYCTDEVTTRDPVYGYRYLYKVPDYSPVYDWKRTVERTVYDYEYKYPTYEIQAVHEYSKEVQVAEKHATWKMDVYETTPVYRWTKSNVRWERDSSLSKPVGSNVRNVTQTTKRCGEKWNYGEPGICVSEKQN